MRSHDSSRWPRSRVLMIRKYPLLIPTVLLCPSPPSPPFNPSHPPSSLLPPIPIPLSPLSSSAYSSICSSFFSPCFILYPSRVKGTVANVLGKGEAPSQMKELILDFEKQVFSSSLPSLFISDNFNSNANYSPLAPP